MAPLICLLRPTRIVRACPLAHLNGVDLPGLPLAGRVQFDPSKEKVLCRCRSRVARLFPAKLPTLSEPAQSKGGGRTGPVSDDCPDKVQCPACFQTMVSPGALQATGSQAYMAGGAGAIKMRMPWTRHPGGSGRSSKG